MRVRHVLAHEAERLREINLRSLQTDPDAYVTTYAEDAAVPADWWERAAQRSERGGERRFIVVDEQDRWLGTALVRPDETTPGEAVVNAMWVAPEIRGQGASRRLLDACSAWAREHRFRAINLVVYTTNIPAYRAYVAAGFVVIGQEHDETFLSQRLV